MDDEVGDTDLDELIQLDFDIPVYYKPACP